VTYSSNVRVDTIEAFALVGAATPTDTVVGTTISPSLIGDVDMGDSVDVANDEESTEGDCVFAIACGRSGTTLPEFVIFRLDTGTSAVTTGDTTAGASADAIAEAMLLRFI